MDESRNGERAVVLFSAHPWRGNPLGLHHIAKAIAKTGTPVLFVEPPFSPLHLSAGRRRGRMFSAGLRPSGEGNIFLFSPFSLLPYLNLPGLGSEFALKYWPSFSLNRLKAAISGTPFEHSALLICGASHFSSLVFDIKADVRAFRLADDERLFGTVPVSMRRQTWRDLPRYDVVFTTSSPLAEMARTNGARRVVRLPNGVAAEDFNSQLEAPSDLAILQAPRIVYIGALEDWFDWPTFIHAATALPQTSFIVIGDPGNAPDVLPANVHLMGARKHAELGAYLSHCDVGVIPFRLDGREAALGAIDPIKLWEYLASGLPVVASDALSLPIMPEVIHSYHTPDEFVDALKSALAAEKPDKSIDVSQRSWAKIVQHALRAAGM
jgi:glycosyltransferase involved in cell wall biosynthesis